MGRWWSSALQCFPFAAITADALHDSKYHTFAKILSNRVTSADIASPISRGKKGENESKRKKKKKKKKKIKSRDYVVNMYLCGCFY